MVTPAQAFLAAAVLAGVGLCALAVVSYRRQEPASALFGAFLATWGLSPLLDAAVNVLFGVGSLAGLFWVVVVIPWFLFALRYTGRGIERRSLVVLIAPVLGLIPWAIAATTGGPTAAFEVVGILIFVYYAALSFLGAGLVVRATRRYGHLSLSQGAWLAVAGVLPAATMNSFGVLIERAGETLLFGVYAAGFVGVLLAAAVVLFRTDAFESTPAPGTVGRRAIGRETDDLIVIVDDGGRVVSRNEPTQQQLPDSAPPGGDIAAILGAEIDDLRRSETVDLRTVDGVRQFDPQVTALADQHDRHLGWMVSLRDVTEREIQRQRLEVLNRVVRHNLRNRASVIEANTEVVAEELDDDELAAHLATATDAVDELLDLGAKAKTIEELLGREQRRRERIEVDTFLAEVAEECDSRWPGAEVRALDGVDVAVESDPAVLAFALDNLVENAVEHADSPTVELTAETTDGQYPTTIEVTDDGPGIPERERAVIEDGTETPLKHGSGLGLWVTNWAVKDLGGDLAFREREDGGAVEVRLPHQPLGDSGD